MALWFGLYLLTHTEIFITTFKIQYQVKPVSVSAKFAGHQRYVGIRSGLANEAFAGPARLANICTN